MDAIMCSTTCESCKFRKVRCTRTRPTDESCANCVRRQEDCYFGNRKRARKASKDRNPNLAQRSNGSHRRDRNLGHAGKKTHQLAVRAQQHPPLDVEHILQHRRLPGRQEDVNTLYKALDSYVKSSSLAVLSETRLTALSQRLGHNELYDLVERMQAHVQVRRNANKTSYIEARQAGRGQIPVSAQEAEGYVRSYFEHIHPMYPFLNRKDFEERASSMQKESLQSNIAWSALYHGVLALGSQFHNKGDFLPEKGLAWHLFKHALGLMRDLVGLDATLLNVQAITTIAIFSQNLSSYTLENHLVSEAARLAITLNFHKPTEGTESDEKAAVFWVIYCLEKLLSFNDSLSSLIIDFDIGCSIPEAPESILEGCDWFLSSVTLARILSISYETLFSVKAAYNSTEQFSAGIMQVYAGLERWRMSIPQAFRPGESVDLQGISPTLRRILLHQHFSYHSSLMAISRLAIHLGEPNILSADGIGKSSLIQAARTVLELTRFTESKTWSSLWLVGAMPLAALFILFESIVYDPTSAESKSNLFFLDMAAGYFSRLEYDSGGSVRGSIFSEFTFLARKFIHEEQNTNRSVRSEVAIDGADPVPSQDLPPERNGASPQVTSTDILSEALYRPASSSQFVHTDYPFPQSGYNAAGNDSIIVDFMDIFDPMLPNEAWP